MAALKLEAFSNMSSVGYIESGRTFFPFLSLEKLMAWIMFREFLEKESETKISIKVERDKVALMLDE